MKKGQDKKVVPKPAVYESPQKIDLIVKPESIPIKTLKQSNIDWLESHKHHWEMFVSDKIVRNGFNFKEALEIIREEFDEKANFCTWCPEDMGNLMQYLYTQYGNYLNNMSNGKK